MRPPESCDSLDSAIEDIRLLEKELNLYKQALTKSISLPKGVLPDAKDYYTVMLCGNCVVKPLRFELAS